MKLKIFVVEDNMIFQQLIEKELGSICESMEFFTNGEACVENINADLPDVLVLDYHLDGVMTGLDTLKAGRAINPRVYAVVFSTVQSLDTDSNLANYGSFDFVEKTPDSFSRLKEIIISRYPTQAG